MWPSFDAGYMEYANVWAMYYARYPGLGMRYGAEICTIVISMNGAFKWCPFSCGLNFGPKSCKQWIVAFGRVHILAKIWPTLKSTFRTLFERSFHADHNDTIPSFISHSHTKIQCDSPWIMNAWSIGIRPNASAMWSALAGPGNLVSCAAPSESTQCSHRVSVLEWAHCY